LLELNEFRTQSHGGRGRNPCRLNRVSRPQELIVYFFHPLAIFLFAFLTSCSSPTLAPRPTPALIRVAVTDLTQPLLLDLSATYALANPDVVVAPSLAPEANLSSLLSAGQADLALTTSPDPKLFATPIGYVPFQVVTHPSNPLTQLSLDQVQALFAGRIADWGQVGGIAGPVLVVTRGVGTDAERAISATAMGPFTVNTSALVAPTWPAMRQLVGQNTSAIGYLIGPELDAGVKPLPLQAAAGAPVQLHLLAVAEAAADPTGVARAFLAWAQSPAGQAVVAKRHTALKS
jgi:phosphate transport system substrate-binding protein